MSPITSSADRNERSVMAWLTGGLRSRPRTFSAAAAGGEGVFGLRHGKDGFVEDKPNAKILSRPSPYTNATDIDHLYATARLAGGASMLDSEDEIRTSESQSARIEKVSDIRWL